MRHLTAVCAALFLVGCQAEPQVLSIAGETMGTTYSITAIDPTNDVTVDAVQAAVEATLGVVNGQMSNWDPNSEISQFNAAQTTEAIEISEELALVMDVANAVHTQSDGQFDVTLGPLIGLWGFGQRTPDSPIPDDAAIEAAMQIVGQADLLSLTMDPPTMAKASADTEVFLAAIAKGYGVDQIGATLEGLGLEDYLVEIGGDLLTSGKNSEGEDWRIGIERPEPGGSDVEEIVSVSGLGMATSGDYRNFFEVDGVRYSHIIDANTGRPITHATASVTVLAEDAMLADAWATALLVLGEERGMEISRELDLASFFIVRDTTSSDPAFITISSPRFEELQSGS
ncbi:MAG: FAD:protein FMN transferase [Pseudomonadota bacterium]